MTTMTAPSTPKSQVAQAAVSTPSPGTWRHPRADEIAQRQKANTFDDSNLRKIVWNGGALGALLYVSSHNWIPDMFKLQAFEPVTTPVVFLLYLLGLYNMTIALLPLIRNKDEITDIPLTPAQRALLGLNPNATPPLAPGTQYTTPPRYPPSPTPRHVSPITSSPNGLGSPISRSPSFGRERSASPSASPLWQKTVSRGQVLARKSSSGTPSPLGPGIGMRDVSSVLGTPNTPSPTAGRGATVGLNNKWLYQKGRASSGSGGIDLFR